MHTLTHNTAVPTSHLDWIHVQANEGEKANTTWKRCWNAAKKHKYTHSKKGFEHKSFIYLRLYAVNANDNNSKKWSLEKMKIDRKRLGKSDAKWSVGQKEMCVKLLDKQRKTWNPSNVVHGNEIRRQVRKRIRMQKKWNCTTPKQFRDFDFVRVSASPFSP